MKSLVFGMVFFGLGIFSVTIVYSFPVYSNISFTENHFNVSLGSSLSKEAIPDTSIFQKDYNDYIQVECMQGALMPHTHGMQELYRHTQGLQLHYQRSMLRNQYHPSLFRKPLYYGTTLNYQHLGSEAAGYAIGLGFSLFIPLDKQLKTRFTTGMGVGYLSNPYSLDNPRNIAIGSYFNGMMRLGVQKDLWVTTRENKQTSIQLNIGMTHFSNGNWSQPNLGINVPYASISYRYRFGSLAVNKELAGMHSLRIQQLNLGMEQNRVIRAFNRDWTWIGGMRFGRRQMEIDQERNFTIGLVEFLAERNYSCEELTNNKRLKSYSAHPHFGLTAFFDRTYQYQKPNPLPPYDVLETTELAALIGNRYVFGRVGVLTDVGFYLYKPSDGKRKFFQALGLSYSINPKWIVTARLKVHSSVADYIEWGLGYRI